MHTVVVYESQYGNTHEVAEAIGAEAASHGTVAVVPVARATPDVLAGADLVVVGGPTHAHGLSRPSTRRGAEDAVATHRELHLDPDHEGDGVREWFESLGAVAGTRAAAFDTRAHGPALATGRASRGIGKRLRHHGFTEVIEPESFFVDGHNRLLDGELARARRWAATLLEAATR